MTALDITAIVPPSQDASAGKVSVDANAKENTPNKANVAMDLLLTSPPPNKAPRVMKRSSPDVVVEDQPESKKVAVEEEDAPVAEAKQSDEEVEKNEVVDKDEVSKSDSKETEIEPVEPQDSKEVDDTPESDQAVEGSTVEAMAEVSNAAIDKST